MGRPSKNIDKEVKTGISINEYKYLMTMAYIAGNSVSEYIRNLIKKDMESNQDSLETIKEFLKVTNS